MVKLSAKAKEFAIKMGIKDFDPTYSYLTGLKKRNGIFSQTKHGESESVNIEKINSWTEVIREQTKNFLPKDIYNFDETDLFYQLLPSKTCIY